MTEPELDAQVDDTAHVIEVAGALDGLLAAAFTATDSTEVMRLIDTLPDAVARDCLAMAVLGFADGVRRGHIVQVDTE